MAKAIGISRRSIYMSGILFPTLMLVTASLTWGFTLFVERFAQGEVRERYLPRFQRRAQFSKIIAAAAALWILSEIL